MPEQQGSRGAWRLFYERPQRNVMLHIKCFLVEVRVLMQSDVFKPERAPTTSDLEKGRLLQHVEELWKIVPHFLIHSSHQADLSHGSRPVRS